MNYAELLSDILGVYKKHGWSVSRVLLSKGAPKELRNAEDLIGVEVAESEVDAVWFGRPSAKGKRAIELRWLNETPFALFELVDEDIADDELKKIRSRIELQLVDHASGDDGK